MSACITDPVVLAKVREIVQTPHASEVNQYLTPTWNKSAGVHAGPRGDWFPNRYAGEWIVMSAVVRSDGLTLFTLGKIAGQ